MTARIALDGIGKVFPGVVALDDVGFSVADGEVRALMGENGAGKSTLLKILCGEHRPDAGTMLVNGEAQSFSGPRDSQAAGIAIIHQELQLAPNLTVAENLLLGAMPTQRGILDRPTMREQARSILDRLGESIDPDAIVGDLAIGKRQMIEIGKALLRDARIIAFDEPTSSLSARETETLKQIIADLRADGRAILYVSHRMEEVFEISDSVTVLRDGRHVGDWKDMAAVEEGTLIHAMAGREISDIYGYRSRALGEAVLDVENITGPGVRVPVDLTARRGEVIGFFGLVGAGRSELFKLIFGAASHTGGTIRVDGTALDAGPRAAIAAGIGLCPEDRKDEGIVPLAPVRENVTIAQRNLAGRSALIDREAEAIAGNEAIARLSIKTPSGDTAIHTLSGGNQQKVIIARWLTAEADILLFDEPTRGIDVGARSEIYDHMFTLAEQGGTILFVSSDMPEVIGVADRIFVMRDGTISGELSRDEATPERLLRLALPDAAGRSG